MYRTVSLYQISVSNAISGVTLGANKGECQEAAKKPQTAQEVPMSDLHSLPPPWAARSATYRMAAIHRPRKRCAGKTPETPPGGQAKPQPNQNPKE